METLDLYLFHKKDGEGKGQEGEDYKNSGKEKSAKLKYASA